MCFAILRTSFFFPVSSSSSRPHCFLCPHHGRSHASREPWLGAPRPAALPLVGSATCVREAFLPLVFPTLHPGAAGAQAVSPRWSLSVLDSRLMVSLWSQLSDEFKKIEIS